MNIVFICSSLESGKDGVGDYTRKLAQSLINSGFNILLIGVNDRHLITKESDEKQGNNGEISVKRFSSALSWNKRIKTVNAIINKFNPDVISLQYVPFGFQIKGLPFFLSKRLASLGNYNWHIMFHELWVGTSREESLKSRIIGFMQKKIVQNLYTTLKPFSVFTSNQFYKSCLGSIHVPSQLVPIYSNLLEGDGQKQRLIKLLPETILQNRKHYIVAVFFGKTDLSHINHRINKLAAKFAAIGKTLFLTHVGIGHNIESQLKTINQSTGVNFLIFGQQPEKDITDYLLDADVGLSTYPKIIFEKSGSIAAMLNNNLPVILLKDIPLQKDTRSFPWIKNLDEIDDIEYFLQQPKTFAHIYSYKTAAEKYKEILHAVYNI